MNAEVKKLQSYITLLKNEINELERLEINDDGTIQPPLLLLLNNAYKQIKYVRYQIKADNELQKTS